MSLCYAPPVSAAGSRPDVSRNPESPRHTALVRVTHWITVISFLALLLSGSEIVVSHPRFYWGEVGNIMTHPLFTIPIPASRDTVHTGFNFVMPDQNGWSRYLHFQAAWMLVITGLVYGLAGVLNGHFRRNLLPEPGCRSWAAFRQVVRSHLRRQPPQAADLRSYNILQRSTYLTVIFLLIPLVIWTGLAMSPSFTSAFPATASLLGGRQSARTLHFFISGLLLLFFIVHVVMVARSGFRNRMRAMITGRGRL